MMAEHTKVMTGVGSMFLVTEAELVRYLAEFVLTGKGQDGLCSVAAFVLLTREFLACRAAESRAIRHNNWLMDRRSEHSVALNEPDGVL